VDTNPSVYSLTKIAQAGGQTRDLMGFSYFIPLKQRLTALGMGQHFLAH